MLTDRLILPAGSAEDPEDIFSSSLTLLFPNDLGNQHGSPGSEVTYRSDQFGHIRLQLADPQGEGERLLFSHYVWNAGLQLADLIESSSRGKDGGPWDVRAQRVVELGAGSGLCGILSAMAEAKEVAITDYPAPSILSVLNSNVKNNSNANLSTLPQVHGHQWGDISSPFAQAGKHNFTRVIAADCLWMPAQHENLVRSMLHFLRTAPSDVESNEAGALVVAGFHTGRDNVAAFFDVAEQEGLVAESLWERDAGGTDRKWERQRPSEGIGERKRWCVIAVLKKRCPDSRLREAENTG